MSVIYRTTLFVMITICAVLPNAAVAASTILVFGDSLVSGYGVKRDESVPSRLEYYLQQKGEDVTVINGGVSGDTTAGGKTRIEWMLNKHEPDIVMVVLGGNDMLRRTNPATTKANLSAILTALRNEGVKTILMQVKTPPNRDPAYAAQFNPIYPELAGKFSVPLYPFFLENLFGNRTYMQGDGIHPNAQGLDYIATHLADYIASTGWL